MTLRIPWAFGNVQRTDPAAQQRSTIAEILARAKGGIAGFNEADKAHAALNELAHAAGMGIVIAGENAIAYDDRFELVARWNFPIMPGGHVGADGTPAGPDNRRVGPSRFLLVVVLWDPTTRQAFVVWCWHLIARAGTVNKWRRPLLFASIRRAGGYLAQVLDDVGQAIGFGDTNWSPRFDIPAVAEVLVTTPATMGRARYDKVQKVGPGVSVSGVVAFRTHSDHKALCGKLELNGPEVPRPTVKVTAGGKIPPAAVSVKPDDGRPVRHPWARRTRRWKARHPILWRRILRWRKRHPRR